MFGGCDGQVRIQKVFLFLAGVIPNFRWTPTLISSLSSISIVAVSGGYSHTLLLADSGKVFSCGGEGSNTNPGSLGLGDNTNRSALSMQKKKFVGPSLRFLCKVDPYTDSGDTRSQRHSH